MAFPGAPAWSGNHEIGARIRETPGGRAGYQARPRSRHPDGVQDAYPVRMGRIISAILGTILAIWLVFMAVGWIVPLIKTFAIVTVVAVAVVIAVSLLARRRQH